jgi:hypothetical protein
MRTKNENQINRFLLPVFVWWRHFSLIFLLVLLKACSIDVCCFGGTQAQPQLLYVSLAAAADSRGLDRDPPQTNCRRRTAGWLAGRELGQLQNIVKTEKKHANGRTRYIMYVHI